MIGAAHQTNVYMVLVGKPDGRMPLGRPGRRWGGSYLRYVNGNRKLNGLDSCGSGKEPVAGCDEHSNETSSSSSLLTPCVA